MTPARFLHTVLLLWGDHWQQPCRAFLASHGHYYTRQQLWNFKKGKSPVPEPIALILEQERKIRSKRKIPAPKEGDKNG